MVRAGHGVILAVVSLLLIGIVMIASADFQVGTGATVELRDVLFGGHARVAVMALAALVVASHLPIRRLYRVTGLTSPLPWLLLGTIVALSLVYVPGIGRERNGALRWVEFGPIGFQPSEIAKWSIPVILAWIAARRPASLKRCGSGLMPPLMILGAASAVIALEDLGTAVVIATVGVAVLLAGGARFSHIALLSPVGLGAFAAFAMASPYRLDRLKSFLDPFATAESTGYHVIQSLGAVSGGALGGRGLGNGLQKFGYLPEDTTDFIFAVICEELGLLGAALIVCLFTLLLACGRTIIARTDHPFSRLLGFGILFTVGVQALVNLLVVTGLAPTKGIALPLVSAGGTGWCLTAASLGVLLAIERDTRRAVASAESPAALPAVPLAAA